MKIFQYLTFPIALLLVGAGLILIACCSGHQLNQNFNIPQMGIWSKSGLILLGVILLCAAFVCFYLDGRKKPGGSVILKRLIGKAQKGSYEDFLEETQNYFANHFRDRTSYDYSAHITLSPLPDRSDLLVVEIRYRYIKKLTIPPGEKIRFRFHMARDGANIDRRKPNDSGNYEWQCNLDERDIQSPTPDSFYTIQHLSLKDVDLLPILARLFDTKNNSIVYEASVPAEISTVDPIHIDFAVRFPMERDSFWVIDFDQPTNGCDITLNFSGMGDGLGVISHEFISTRIGPSRISRAEPNSKVLHHKHEGWLMPKNGIVFYWYNTNR